MADTVYDRLAGRPGIQRYPGQKVQLFILREFLDPAHCASLMTLIDETRRPSTKADDNGDPLYRTSETTDLDPAHPSVATLDRRIADLTGLDLACGEPLQGQRYDVGQEFKDHTDYFEPSGADFQKYCAGCGQRTWTVMVYLNQPGAGGATRFRKIDRIIRPEMGKLVAWNNLDAEGRPNGKTLHHGMKVRAGLKFITTKWFRERPWPNG